MYEFQDEGEAFLERERRAILGDAPGLGKTKQALRAAHGKTLVVAPAMIIDTGVWTDERALWRPDLEMVQVPYSSICRRGEKNTVFPVVKPEFRGPWDTVILDEAHYVKGRKANWTRAIERLETDRLYMLTGTAIPNWAYEIYMLLKLAYPGDRRFTNYWRWLKRWFKINTITRRGREVKEIGALRACKPECAKRPPTDPCTHWLRFQEQNLGTKFLRRERQPGMLPPLTEQHLVVPMHPKQRALYNKVKKEFLLEVEGADPEMLWSESKQVAVLAKVATSPQLVDPSLEGRACSGKIELVKQLMEPDRESPTLLVCYFRPTARLLIDEMLKLGRNPAVLMHDTPKAQRRQVVLDFQAGRFDCLVATIGIIKEGLTLTAADRIVFVEHSWRPSSNEQTMRRIHRIGQTRPVSVLHLWSKATLEMRQRRVLDGKTDQQVRALPVAQFAQLV